TGVWDLIDELVRGGTTTLLTTQYLDEADRLADEITVIDHGLVIARGTSAELKRRIGGERVEVTLEHPADAGRVHRALSALACGDIVAHDDPRMVVVPVDDVTGMVPRVVRELDREGVPVRDVAARRSTLDDVFFALTGHPVREPAGEPAGNGSDAPPRA